MAIEILPSEVVDQIAAGEVVERPAHMVKELVENSLDAGATEISVDFGRGGRMVKVTDNGGGIAPEDLSKAFLRFATSKIKLSEDLWQLSSFGFRGEALASIASVSKVTLFSSQETSGTGQRVTCAFGSLSTLEPVSRSRGTTVLVEDLFQNVPARLKFMKGEAAEAGQIKQMLKAMAMAHPQVEFRVLQEGKLLFYWPAVKDTKARIEAVLDISPLYEGKAVRGNVRARAYFTDPHQVSRVSKNLWFFAQSRYVQDRSLQAAVMEAYRHLLMHGEYPYAVCFLETDPSEIDVNIHPTKSQVKFLNPQDAFRAVQGSIRTVLEQAPWLHQNPETSIGVSYRDQSSETSKKIPPQSQNPLLREPEVEVIASMGAGTEEWGGDAIGGAGRVAPPATPREFDDPAFQTTQFRHKSPWESSLEVSAPVKVLTPPAPFIVPPAAHGTSGSAPSSTHPESPRPLIRHWSLLQVIGQAGLTYVVCQSDKGVVLIDQHAAHERVAFERLMRAWKGGSIEVQSFLFPLSVDLNEEKIEALRPHFPAFAKLGIELEELGPITLGVKSAPALLKEKVLVEEIERFTTEVLQWGDSPLLEKAIGDICARMACHSVLRAGQSLSVPEMRRLLEEMDEHPLSSFCPHGRPVSVTYSWPELEKDFGRRL